VLHFPIAFLNLNCHILALLLVETLVPRLTYIDPYDAEERSPLATNAINSSCYELAALQHHYLASISTLAKIFTEVFTKPEFNMEDFLDHGYGTVSGWFHAVVALGRVLIRAVVRDRD
jgi:hypothetical protein